jgi:hypothetical protein
VEHLITVRVLPDGRYTMKFVTRGDSTDVFNDDFPHPFGSPWTTHIATEIKNEETTWIMETSGLLSGPVAFAAGESSPIQLAHPIDVKRTVGMLGTRYSVIQFFKGREVFRKYPKFGDSLGNTEDDSTKWIGEALYYIGTTAINDLQEDSTTLLENILAERIENYIRGYVDRKNFTELYSIGDSASLFVDDVLQPFLTQLPANYPAAYQDAVDRYSNEMKITGQLQDDQFKFHIFLPGVVISTNADSIAGDTLLWTFGLKDFLNDDYILEAESIVYSKKRIQFAIIVVTLLILIIAVILIKFKR